jgi:hypothetical protein
MDTGPLRLLRALTVSASCVAVSTVRAAGRGERLPPLAHR